MKWKSILTVCLTGIVAASLLAGCGNDKADKKADASKPLRVATNATFVPFEFKEDANSKEYQGFEMDLLRAVAKEMGRDLEISRYDSSIAIRSVYSPHQCNAPSP